MPKRFIVPEMVRKMMWEIDVYGREWIIALRDVPNFLSRLFGGKEKIKRFRGSCTVWNEMPSFRRAGTLTERMLCNIWEREKYNMLKGDKK